MEANEDGPRVIDNSDEERYELWVGEVLAGTIVYRSKPGRIVLIHTEVDPTLEGKGLAALLVRGALEDLRARDLKLVPDCSFVRSYLRRHPQYLDLVHRRRTQSRRGASPTGGGDDGGTPDGK